MYATGREPGSVRQSGSDVKSIVSVIDTESWEVLEWFEAHDSTHVWMAFSADGNYAYVTGGIRGDHGTLHLDPELNEMWITYNSSFEIVVFDLDKREVKSLIPMPEGGRTHSGAFVQYNPDFTGSVLSETPTPVRLQVAWLEVSPFEVTVLMNGIHHRTSVVRFARSSGSAQRQEG